MTEVSSIIEFSSDIADAVPPSPLPARDYVSEIRSALSGFSKKGKRMITLGLFVDPGSYPADYKDGNPEGTTLSYYVICDDTPAGRWNTKKLCEAAGVPMSRNLDVNTLVGNRVRLSVAHEEFEGILRAKASRIDKNA